MNDQFGGATMGLRTKLGSLHVFYDSRFIPEAYMLSDQEFREVIAKKEVYAVFENKHELKFRSYEMMCTEKNGQRILLERQENHEKTTIYIGVQRSCSKTVDPEWQTSGRSGR